MFLYAPNISTTGVNKVKANAQGKGRLWYLPVDQTVHPLIDYRTKLPR